MNIKINENKPIDNIITDGYNPKPTDNPISKNTQWELIEKDEKNKKINKCEFISPCGLFKGKMLCYNNCFLNKKYCDFHQSLTDYLRLNEYPLYSNEYDDNINREQIWNEFIRNGV